VRVLLDECVPRKLGSELVGHDVKTVPAMGWAAYKNGALLARAEASFDVFVTVDRNLSFQQRLSGFNIGVIVLAALSNRLEDLRPLVPKILDALPQVKKGEALVIRA
jgi:hypothetical protein